MDKTLMKDRLINDRLEIEKSFNDYRGIILDNKDYLKTESMNNKFKSFVINFNYLLDDMNSLEEDLFEDTFKDILNVCTNLELFPKENVKVRRISSGYQIILRYVYQMDPFFIEIDVNSISKTIAFNLRWALVEKPYQLITISEFKISDEAIGNHLTYKFELAFKDKPKEALEKVLSLLKEINTIDNELHDILDPLKFIPDGIDFMITKTMEASIIALLNKFNIAHYSFKMNEKISDSKSLLDEIHNNVRIIEMKSKDDDKYNMIELESDVDAAEYSFIFKDPNNDNNTFKFIFCENRIEVEYNRDFLGDIRYVEEMQKYKFVYDKIVDFKYINIMRKEMPDDFREILFNLNRLLSEAVEVTGYCFKVLEDTLCVFNYTHIDDCCHWIRMLKERLVFNRNMED